MQTIQQIVEANKSVILEHATEISKQIYFSNDYELPHTTLLSHNNQILTFVVDGNPVTGDLDCAVAVGNGVVDYNHQHEQFKWIDVSEFQTL